MKKEEAVKYLQQLYPYGGHCWLDKQRTEAIGMAIQALQEEPVKIKKGCKYRCLSDMVNKDTGNIAFIGDKIYLAPKDNTLVSEENGWLCDTSENASNFELVEEPVSEELEEAVDTYLATYFGSEKEKQEWPFLKKMAIHFAEWQKQKDSILISEELEEACEKFRWNIEESCYQNDNGTYTYSSDNIEEAFKAGAKWKQEKEYTCYEEAFEDGAKWKKEQMMADAISAKVTEIYYPTDSCLEIEATLPESRFKDGDKVLIIKKD